MPGRLAFPIYDDYEAVRAFCTAGTPRWTPVLTDEKLDAVSFRSMEVFGPSPGRTEAWLRHT